MLSMPCPAARLETRCKSAPHPKPAPHARRPRPSWLGTLRSFPPDRLGISAAPASLELAPPASPRRVSLHPLATAPAAASRSVSATCRGRNNGPVSRSQYVYILLLFLNSTLHPPFSSNSGGRGQPSCCGPKKMKPLGQTKERKTTLEMGLGIVMTKSLKLLRMTTANAGGAPGPA